ncbi:hypothetical protein HDU96_010198 [Phlyctochytrium bullatum]|nr:hypothetical protein HDU96_010198 [Phlyctochytrium bullatum]
MAEFFGRIIKVSIAKPGKVASSRADEEKDVVDDAEVKDKQVESTGEEVPEPPLKKTKVSNPRVFFEIEIGGASVGRIVMELRADVVPNVVFGEVLTGMDVLRQIEKEGNSSGKTKRRVKIVDCGQVDS